MKRIIAVVFILLMVGLIGAPSFAIETKVTGSLTVDGILNTRDIDGDKSTMAYSEMAVELNTVSQINEKIKLVTQTEILDKVISNYDSNVGDGGDNENDNIQVDRAYMDILTPIGLLSIGRMEVNIWGTGFYDDGYSGGQIRLISPIPLGDGKLYLGGAAEKAHEGNEDGTWTSNRDNDQYFMTGTYVTKSYRAGLLVGYYPMSSFIDTALDLDADFIYVAPYFSGKAGPLMINAEYGQISGDYEMRKSASLYSFYNNIQATKGDIDTSCFWLEVGYPVGKANIELGYYYMSGDKTSAGTSVDGYEAVGNAYSTAYAAAYAASLASDPTDTAAAATAGTTAGVAAAQAAFIAGIANGTVSGFDDIESAASFNLGEDWEKVFILTANDHGIGGNILERGSAMNTAGMSMFYLSGDFDVTDSVNVYGLFAMATADATAAGNDDNYGMEFDLGFNWNVMDNLEYNGRAGYLMGGDWFEDVMGQKDLTLMALYHEVVLSF